MEHCDRLYSIAYTAYISDLMMYADRHPLAIYIYRLYNIWRMIDAVCINCLVFRASSHVARWNRTDAGKSYIGRTLIAYHHQHTCTVITRKLRLLAASPYASRKKPISIYPITLDDAPASCLSSLHIKQSPLLLSNHNFIT